MKTFEDNEIIKAVECCIGNTKCGECPMFRTPNCMNKVFGYALDLINRKDTKIAELEAEVEKLNDILPKNKDMIVILPCEIGTRIYQVIDEYDAKRNGCSRCLADFGFKTECAYCKNKDCTNLTANKHWQIISRRFELKDKDLFGEMIFLTHTEAEAKLNEINARYAHPTEKGGEGVMAELLPCPFCGGEARIIVVEKGVHSIIECTTHYCGFMRHSFNNGDTDEHAALRLTTAWNTRTPKERGGEK